MFKSRPQSPARSGFTLIEMLVVISIVALLVALLLPAIKKSKEEGKRIQCQSNLRQWGMALYYYTQDSTDIMPVTVNKIPASWIGDWSSAVIPYMPAMTASSGPGSNALGCPAIPPNRLKQYDGVVTYQYHPNGNIWSWQTNGTEGTLWVKYSLITKSGRTPSLFDAAGRDVANPYESWYGGTGSLDYGSIKFRHNETVNMTMLDTHIESFRGNYVDEGNLVDASKYGPGGVDEPQNPDALLANGPPYFWHYFRKPYEVY
jgi:prepilin-type N-terminal cleavage/methylation domain-containing protein/prepilin-type processing-associated H-X9-DG protein